MTSTTDPAILALITIVGTVITAQFKLLNDNNKALTKLADNSLKVAEETANGNREAKERNGHLGEQNIQIAQLVTNQGADLASIKEINQENADTNARVEKILIDSAQKLENFNRRKNPNAKNPRP